MQDPGRRVWLITGASSGFGRAIAAAALAAGDYVVGAARHVELLGWEKTSRSTDFVR